MFFILSVVQKSIGIFKAILGRSYWCVCVGMYVYYPVLLLLHNCFWWVLLFFHHQVFSPCFSYGMRLEHSWWKLEGKLNIVWGLPDRFKSQSKSDIYAQIEQNEYIHIRFLWFRVGETVLQPEYFITFNSNFFPFFSKASFFFLSFFVFLFDSFAFCLSLILSSFLHLSFWSIWVKYGSMSFVPLWSLWGKSACWQSI